MDLKAVGGFNNVPARADAGALKNKKAVEKTAEPNDKITISDESFLKKAFINTTKIVAGTALAVVFAPAKAIAEGAKAASASAVNALAMEAGSDDPNTISPRVRAMIQSSSVVGAAAGLALAGPVGMALGIVAAPGIAVGAEKAFIGGVRGAAKGWKAAMNTADSVSSYTEKIFGKTSAKIAHATTTVLLGATLPAVMAVGGAILNNSLFALRALGAKDYPTGIKEKLDNALAIGITFMSTAAGVVSGYGVGAAVMPGAVATSVKGGAAAAEGFADGIVRSFKAANAAVDHLIDGKKA